MLINTSLLESCSFSSLSESSRGVVVNADDDTDELLVLNGFTCVSVVDVDDDVIVFTAGHS